MGYDVGDVIAVGGYMGVTVLRVDMEQLRLNIPNDINKIIPLSFSLKFRLTAVSYTHLMNSNAAAV